jgi:hypothetical protein
MWTAYCDCFKHTLIVSDPQYGAPPGLINDKTAFPPGRALMVYSFNRKTKDISGRFIDNWNLISRHVIDRHTLSSKLPVDIIEVCNIRKMSSKEHGKHVKVHVTRSKYMKSDDTPLYLTKDHTIFNRKRYTQDENEKLLAQAGFIPHPNCIISLPLHAHTKFSKTITQLLPVHPEEEIEHNTISKLSTKGKLHQLKLFHLPIGVYDVKEITPRKSTFGRFLISIYYQGSISTITSNKILDACIPAGGIKSLNDTGTVAQLHILQKKRDHSRNIIVNADLIIDN